MDSITQIALGAATASVCVPKEHRRKAVLIGAFLGTLPDLDVLIDYGDAVANFTYHRGFSHSLFVLFPFSLLVWFCLKQIYEPVRSAPKPWLLAIVLALMTHPLLDAHTAYGTQLFWPLTTPPIMWSTIFIIDPLYTLPLLLAVILISFRPHKPWAFNSLKVGLFLSSCYLAWTWAAKIVVEKRVEYELQDKQTTARIYVTPTAFNSLLWRIVVLYDEHYLEGYYSFLQTQSDISFKSYSKNNELFEKVAHLWAAKRLDWFAQGFIKTTSVEDYIVIADLRMGFEENYAFNHAIAKQGNPHVYEMESIRLESDLDLDDLDLVWQKLVAEP